MVDPAIVRVRSRWAALGLLLAVASHVGAQGSDSILGQGFDRPSEPSGSAEAVSSEAETCPDLTLSRWHAYFDHPDDPPWVFHAGKPGGEAELYWPIEPGRPHDWYTWRGPYDGKHLEITRPLKNYVGGAGQVVDSGTETLKLDVNGDCTQMTGTSTIVSRGATQPSEKASFTRVGPVAHSGGPPAMLGVTLACQTHFADPGEVVCDAQPTNARADADVVYEWSFDDAPKADASGSSLTLYGVTPSQHTVTVVARDRKNGLASAPRSVSFVKEATEAAEGGEVANRGGATRIGPQTGGVPPEPFGVPGEQTAAEESAAEPGGFPWGKLGLGAVLALGAAIAVHLRGRQPRAVPPSPAAPRADRPPSPKPEPSPADRETTTAKPPTPPEKREQRDTELELTVDQKTISVSGDGKDRATVQTHAYRIANGVRTDVSSEVRVTVEVSEAKKLRVAGPNAGAFFVSGTHVGGTAFSGTLTLTGVSLRTGKRTNRVTVDVTVKPLEAVVRVVAWKQGFLYQDTQETLSRGCAKVSGRVRSRDPSADDSQGLAKGNVSETRPDGDAAAGRPVGYGHCRVSFKADGASWSAPVEVETTADGTFEVDLPPEWVAVFGEKPALYELARPVDLSLHPTVLDQLSAFAEQTSALPPRAEFASARRRCNVFRRSFFELLCGRPEDQFERICSALNVLRASIVFVLKNRREFEYQRGVIVEQVKVVFGVVIDVATDLLPIASGLYGWALEGKALGRLPSLRDLILAAATRLVKLPGGKLALKGALFVLKAPLAAARLAIKGLAAFYRSVVELARKVGRRPFTFEDFDEGPGLIVPLIASEAMSIDPALAQELDDAMRPLLQAAGWLLLKIEWCLRLFVHLVLLLVALVTKVLATAIVAAFQTFRWKGAGKTWEEFIEKWIGDRGWEVYSPPGERSFGGWIAAWLVGAFVDIESEIQNWFDYNLRGKSPETAASTPTKWDLGQVVMDKLAPLSSLDRHVAVALEEACQRAEDLDVPDDWREAVHRVTRSEVTALAEWQRQADRMRVFEEVSMWAKLFAKAVQAFLFSAAVFAEGVARVARLAAAEKAALERAESFNKLGGTIEKWVDILDLAFRALILFVFEFTRLGILFFAAPMRIGGLLEVSRGALR